VETELTVQGTFVHSKDVRPEFRTALQDLHGKTEVTPTEQINRLREMVVYSPAQNFAFYHNLNEYTATTDGDIDITGEFDAEEDEYTTPPTYPAVAISEIRTPEQGEVNHSRADYLVRMSVGVTRGDQQEESP